MNKENSLQWFLQFCRFGIVGVTAAIVHYSVVVALVQKISMPPLMANIFGFLIAFQVSYWGHCLWTFNDAITLHRHAFPKLFLVQSLNFLINELLYYLFMVWGLPYKLALIIVLIILPTITFVSSKLWVFQSKTNV